MKVDLSEAQAGYILSCIMMEQDEVDSRLRDELDRLYYQLTGEARRSAPVRALPDDIEEAKRREREWIRRHPGIAMFRPFKE